jgi:hypothetical protein
MTNLEIPKYRIYHILKLYEASKDTLGFNLVERRMLLYRLIRLYYPWENMKSLKIVYDKFIKSKEIDYMVNVDAKKLKLKNKKMVKELFGSVDINGDNSIDLKEFKYALRDIENIDCEELFKNADLNGDGVLDEDEFYKFVASVPIIRDNFGKILYNTLYEINKKDFERQSRIFKVDVSNRRPSLSDLRIHEDICSFDIPLYGVSLSPVKSRTIRRYYGL